MIECTSNPNYPERAHRFFVGRGGEFVCSICNRTAAMISVSDLYQEVAHLRARLQDVERALGIGPDTLPPPQDPVKQLKDLRSKQAVEAVEALVRERQEFERFDDESARI